MSDDREMTAKELRNQIRVLTAEVRALRGELEQAKGAVLYHMCLELKATIARVEALCHMQHEDSAVSIGDIRAALRGEP